LPMNDRRTRASRDATGYALVVVSVVLTTLVRLALDPLLGHKAPLIMYFPALVLSAWVGGWVGGLAALVLSALAATYFFLSPHHSLSVASQGDRLTLVIFTVVGLSVSALSASQRRARQQAEDTAAVLREREAFLRESEVRKSAVLEVALDCIITADARGRILEFNPAAEKTFGYARAEVLGRTIADTIVPPSLREAHLKGLGHYLAAGEGPILRQRIEVVGMRKGGEEFPVEIAIVPTASGSLSGDGLSRHDTSGHGGSGRGGVEFTAYLRDITQSKLDQARLSAAAQREALLGRIGQAVLWSPDPAAFQSTALALLGERLAADRCFYVLYDEARNTARIEKDWCREGVPSLEGEWDLTEHGMVVMDIYQTGRTVVVEDVATDPLPPRLVELFLETGQRSYVAVPFFDQGHPVAALTVMMASAARTWSEEEVALVEAAAIQVRGAMEAVRAAQRERESQARQRQFLRDVLASVTEGHLLLCHGPDDLPAPLTPFGGPVALSREGGLRELRHLALDAAVGMPEEARHDLATAASEAGMNAVVHGGGGTGWVSVGEDGTVQVRVEDHGTGITMENLPRAALSRGFSTKETLGHGLKMMLETADRLYLLTGSGGTTVVLEQQRERPLPAWL